MSQGSVDEQVLLMGGERREWPDLSWDASVTKITGMRRNMPQKLQHTRAWWRQTASAQDHIDPGLYFFFKIRNKSPPLSSL